MSENTKIEWADHTFNPWLGCTKVSPMGCANCYAEADFDKRRHRVVWGAGQPRSRTKTWGDPVRWNKQADAFFAEHGRRQRVFCASLADVFDNEVDPQWRDDLWKLIWATPNLDWLLLTKRIGNAKDMIFEARRALLTPGELYNPAPLPNVWIGATICNQTEAGRDIPKLLVVPAAKRFLSMEPLLGPVDLSHLNDGKEINEVNCLKPYTWDEEIAQWRGTEDGWEESFEDHYDVSPIGLTGPMHAGIDWVIVGGESGPNARPMHPDLARSLRDQCQSAGVPFLFKQWGEYLPIGQSLPDHGKVHGATGVKPGRMKLHYGGTPNQAPKFAFADHGVEVRSFDDTSLTCRVGKKAAGRLLDGREWNGVPA